MVETTSPERGLITSQLIGQQIDQLRLTGLFLGLTGRIGSELDRIRGIHHTLGICFEVAKTHALEPRLEGIPAIYNPSSWTSDRLCGYTGRDLEITAENLAASYLESWLAEMRLGSASSGLFLKCALWFSETHGRDPLTGLGFLLDLFEHGYFVDVTIFTDVLNSYVRFHALGVDLSFMAHASVAGVSLVNKNLERIKREYEEVELDSERLDTLVSAVVDLTVDRIDRARRASSLDEWIVGEASTCGPVWWLSRMHYAAASLDLGILTRRMLTRFEEIGADLHASVGLRVALADHDLPPVWELGSLERIAAGYRERYSDQSWLDHMAEDRLVFPDQVRELVRPAGPGAFTGSPLPPEWRIPSERLALPLSLAHGRHPSVVRSIDFGAQEIEAMVRRLGLPPGRDGSRIAARRRLLELESETLVEGLLLMPPTSPVAGYLLGRVRTLYPWHPVLSRLEGVLRGLQGDLDGALTSLRNCLMIEPDGVANWMAVAKLAERRNAIDDASALRQISRLVANLHPAGQ